MKTVLNILISIFVLTSIILFYFAFFKEPVIKIYCNKKTRTQILNAKLAINFTVNSEEDYYINNHFKSLSDQCRKEETKFFNRFFSK